MGSLSQYTHLVTTFKRHASGILLQEFLCFDHVHVQTQILPVNSHGKPQDLRQVENGQVIGNIMFRFNALLVSILHD